MYLNHLGNYASRSCCLGCDVTLRFLSKVLMFASWSPNDADWGYKCGSFGSKSTVNCDYRLATTIIEQGSFAGDGSAFVRRVEQCL